MLCPLITPVLLATALDISADASIKALVSLGKPVAESKYKFFAFNSLFMSINCFTPRVTTSSLPGFASSVAISFLACHIPSFNSKSAPPSGSYKDIRLANTYTSLCCLTFAIPPLSISSLYLFKYLSRSAIVSSLVIKILVLVLLPVAKFTFCIANSVIPAGLHLLSSVVPPNVSKSNTYKEPILSFSNCLTLVNALTAASTVDVRISCCC